MIANYNLMELAEQKFLRCDECGSVILDKQFYTKHISGLIRCSDCSRKYISETYCNTDIQ